jgi:GNAT superfamily N-acetyltransferase
LAIYESLGWNSLQLTIDELEKMCKQSWYAIYAYNDQKLVGMGRIISDGVITALICGVCVHPTYQSRGIGAEIVSALVEYCEKEKVIPQLMCVESLEGYYTKFGFHKFSIGMKSDIKRGTGPTFHSN